MIYLIVGNNDNMKKDSQSNISHPRSRNIYLDIVKGIAIILVVFGHNIQYGSFECNNGDFFENPLFIAIYSRPSRTQLTANRWYWITPLFR